MKVFNANEHVACLGKDIRFAMRLAKQDNYTHVKFNGILYEVQ